MASDYLNTLGYSLTRAFSGVKGPGFPGPVQLSPLASAGGPVWGERALPQTLTADLYSVPVWILDPSVEVGASPLDPAIYAVILRAYCVLANPGASDALVTYGICSSNGGGLNQPTPPAIPNGAGWGQKTIRAGTTDTVFAEIGIAGRYQGTVPNSGLGLMVTATQNLSLVAPPALFSAGSLSSAFAVIEAFKLTDD